MKFGSFLLKRLFMSVFVLIGLTIIIFVISRVVPGDPARLALGERATQKAVNTLREEMHLNDPLPTQYFYWLKGALSGNFGKSLITKRPVLQDIQEFLPATLELAITASVILVIFSILLGSIAAWYKNKWPDTLIRILAYVGVAIPGFVLAALLLMFFGYIWKVVPVPGRLSNGITVNSITGFMMLDSLLTGNFKAFVDAFGHIILPAISLSCAGLFQEARIMRNAMTENMNKDCLIAHKGYGIPGSLIMRKYLLKPSLIPTVSVLGLDIASLVGGAFLVETIFTWPGISYYATNAILQKDLNAVSAVVLVFGIIFVIVNFVVDLVIAYLDPRVRL